MDGRRGMRLAVACVLSVIVAAGPFASPASPGGTLSRRGGTEFKVYATRFSGGEPTLAVGKGGAIFVQAFERTIKSSDGGRTWKQVHVPASGGVTFDPYIHADEKTGRILSSQLLVVCQMLSMSNDGGNTWTDIPTQCPAGDHQKIGSGPWRNPLGKLYPRAFYTCLNDVGDTACSMSLDGGYTWLPPVMVFPGFDPNAPNGVGGMPGVCGGLEGDPVSGPDGTIYVPREYCGRPFVGVSKDDGLTWTRHYVARPAQTRPIAWGGNNPSVTVDAAGIVYYAWTGADWRHHVSYSKDKGKTWSKPVTLSHRNGSTTFPTIIAGRKGSVATAYIGTPDSPKGPDDVPKRARWYLYVSYSFNAHRKGADWTTKRASGDVVQIGCIGRHGPTCGHGNLLDFIDSAWTHAGRLAVVYADGCIKCKKAEKSTSSRVNVAVQKSGPTFRAPR